MQPTAGPAHSEGSRVLGYAIPLLLALPAALMFFAMNLHALLVSAPVMLAVAFVLSIVARGRR